MFSEDLAKAIEFLIDKDLDTDLINIKHKNCETIIKNTNKLAEILNINMNLLLVYLENSIKNKKYIRR